MSFGLGGLFGVDDFGRPMLGPQPSAGRMPVATPYSFAGGAPLLGDDAANPLPPGMGGLRAFGALAMPQPEPQAPGGALSFGPGAPGSDLPLPSQAATGSAPSAPRIRPFGSLPVPVQGGPDAAPGKVTASNPPLPPARPVEFGGAGTWDQPEGAPQAPAAVAGAPGAELGAFDRFRSALAPYSDDLMGIAQGLMSVRGFGPAVAAGLKYADERRNSSAARDLASAKQASELFKLRQQLGNSDQLAQLAMQKNPGMTMDQARAAVGNQSYANELLKGFVPPTEQYRQETDDKGNVWKINTRTGERTVSLPAKDDKAPTVHSFTLADGSKVDRVFNSQSGQWEAPGYGANPPVAQQDDTTGIPPGVDADTYRKELAKKTVAQQSSATDRAAQARNVIPILDRAEQAYSALGQASGIGPLNASTLNRTIGGALGASNEKLRQEYEAAAKDLELYKAQISMKGQGAITEGERRLLALTLPRLDAADPQTGLRTLRDLRSQFERAMTADRLPSYGQGGGQPASAPAPQSDMQRRATRFEELTRGGLSKQDAFARMRQEGL